MSLIPSDARKFEYRRQRQRVRLVTTVSGSVTWEPGATTIDDRMHVNHRDLLRNSRLSHKATVVVRESYLTMAVPNRLVLLNLPLLDTFPLDVLLLYGDIVHTNILTLALILDFRILVVRLENELSLAVLIFALLLDVLFLDTFNENQYMVARLCKRSVRKITVEVEGKGYGSSYEGLGRAP